MALLLRVTQRAVAVDRRALFDAATRTKAAAGHNDWALSVNIVSDRYMARLNRTYRPNTRGATDILSFSPHALSAPERWSDAPEAADGLRDLGDVFMAPAFIERRFRARHSTSSVSRSIFTATSTSSVSRQLATGGDLEVADPYGEPSLAGAYEVLLVHGIVHLLGYDHQAPAEAALMRAREVQLLGLLRGAPPGSAAIDDR